ncbi:hypothetical protein BKA64DRAFT_738788 [Cadophora sp. MPI-SDFR-AT-0126]|nr:hypothetical protein BKA64DRAFT_738788 [Leotiomycetes sp. MPI-SDFR-AT-0126]
MASSVAVAESALVVRTVAGNAASSMSTPPSTPTTKDSTPTPKDSATTTVSATISTTFIAAETKTAKRIPKLTYGRSPDHGDGSHEVRRYEERVPCLQGVRVRYSSMLDAAFNGPFAEGKSGVMTIDDIGFPSIFGSIQSWMYTQKLTSPYDDPPCTFEVYCTIWILADRLLMPKLQNDVAAAMLALEHGSQLIFQGKMAWIYRNTTPDSKLRRLIVDLCAFQMDEKVWAAAGASQTVPGQFLVGVALAIKADHKCLQKYHVSLKDVLRLDYCKVDEGAS